MAEVQIYVKGRQISKYYDQYGNTFVEGRRGSDYVIRITNPTGCKIKAVVSVDGVNVLTGDQRWEKGYVIFPNSHVDIPGWRIDSKKAAKFIFADLKDGYANGSSNSGVIGAMIFYEQQPLFNLTFNNQIYPMVSGTGGVLGGGTWGTNGGTCGSNGASGGASGGNGGGFGRGTSSASSVNVCASGGASLMSNSLATGWGESTTFQTEKLDAKFYETPSQTLAIYYDSARGLERRGILVRQTYSPNPFPQSNYKDFGCPPPPKYRSRKR